MSFYRELVLPRLLHLSMRHPTLVPIRARTLAGAHGRTLEIGIGSGLNLAFYGSDVTSVIGIDPSPRLLAMARRQASRRAASVTLLEGTAESLPIETASIDSVVTTWSLCSIPEVHLALAEARRVLRPGGRLLFVEHGRAREARTARWQDRLDPLWQRIAGGCHLNRAIDTLIAEGAFRIEKLRNFHLRGPRTHTFLYEGSATPR